MNKNQSVVSLTVSLIVVIAAYTGHTLDPSILTTVLSLAVIIAMTIYTAYKNHNFTSAALYGQKLMDSIKSGMTVTEAALALADDLTDDGEANDSQNGSEVDQDA